MVVPEYEHGKDVTVMHEGVEFHIDVRPISISFKCPHCGKYVKVPWSCVDEPECWEDDWAWIECPCCSKEVKLGEYDYD